MKHKFIFLLALSFLTIKNLDAQDIHFSQYWASPLNLNPALTGVIDKNVRFTAIYRNQWFHLNSFSTYSVSVDGNLFRNKLGGSLLGVGGSFYQDFEGNGEFKNTGVNFNLAYNQRFGNRKVNHYLGLGLGAAFFSKQINLRNLIYGNLFENNNNTDPLDVFNYKSVNLFDFGAGINYFMSIKERHSMGLGFAVQHIAQPNVSFDGNQDDVMYRKFSVNASGKILLNNDFIGLIPTFLFQNQGPHGEIDFGGYVMFLFDPDSDGALYVGAQYRLSRYQKNTYASDAIILGLRGTYKALDIGFAYDLTTSNLRNSKAFFGGPEVYAIVAFGENNSRSREKLNCPKF